MPEADKSELESLDAVFCKNRKGELFVGSVMSNIGYSQAASGISAVIKVLLGYHNGILAANLNCNNPRRDVAALREGRMRILIEHQQFRRTYAAVNGLAITGVNAHILLQGHDKPKDLSRYTCDIPHLVTISARQDFSVKKIIDDLKSHPIDPEELALLHNIHETRISGHLGRGFIILDTNKELKTISLCEKTRYFDDVQRPLWFVYSGMGSQWAGMGTQLMGIPTFASAIHRCHQILKPKGVDVIKIITSSDKTTFDNILNSFVGIAAIQIGLTDILQELGFAPDNIIGHSVGELGCAYADGCFTAEEMILAAYYRGLVSVQTPFIRGSMAAVGMGYKQVLKICPSEIEVACHNGPESCTISGPANVMKEFVAELTSKQIFAKEVPCSNIAYHSRYIAEAGPALLKYLGEVIKSPKPRSARWLSTSVPQNMWNEPRAKFSSAEYHTNNLLNSVLFEETSRLIPPNAVLIEIAPHGLLQAILKRSLPETCCHVPLTNRSCLDNVQFLLEAIGNLYMEGYYPKIKALYPQIEFPVSTGTPFLSHLVEWVHYEKWNTSLYLSAHRKEAASCKFVYSINDDENKYLGGNIVKGNNKFPYAAALAAAWDVLAMILGVPKKQLSVQFQDIKFYAQPVLHDQRQLRLFVSLHRGTGLFEIMNEDTKIATGYITREIIDVRPFEKEFKSSQELVLKSDDIYQLLFKKGYDYRDEFKVIHSANKCLTEAKLCWRNNWVTLIDGMLQLNDIRHQHDSISVPTYIRRIVIDVEKHLQEPVDNYSLMTAHVFDTYNLVRCGGISIEDIILRHLSNIETDINTMTLKFVPFFQQAESEILTALLVYVQTVAENLNKTCIKILELSENKDDISHISNLIESLNKIPNIEVQHKIILRKEVLGGCVSFVTDVDMLLVHNLSTDNKICQTLYRVLCPNMFLANIESRAQHALNRPSTLYRVVSSQHIRDQRLELLRWRPTSTTVSTSAFTVRSPSDINVLTSTLASLPQQHKLIIMTSYPPIDGLKDFVQKWRKERDQIQVIMISQKLDEHQNVDQLSKDLTFSILHNGQWGGAFFVPIHKKTSKSRDISLQVSRINVSNSLNWVDMSGIKAESGIKISVFYAGINSIDVKRWSREIPQVIDQNGFGMDFSGLTQSGERVMGLVSNGAVSSSVLGRPELLWPVPEHWSLDEAATVPAAYCLAFYCLCIKFKLCPGMSVLVHGGSGAVGQAVISVALGYDCKVYTTVSDVRKKRFLQKLFPELTEKQIGNSRDHTFGDMVLSGTNGFGCDIVISCIKEDLKNVCLKSTASYGVTLDLTQITNQENFYYEMFNMTKNRSYSAIDFRQAIVQLDTNILKKLQVLVSEGIKRNYVRPLSRMVFSPLEVSRAFRLIATSRHRGRVLIQLRTQGEKVFAQQIEFRCETLDCLANSSHLILCNDDLLGLRIAERLVKRGARKIYLHGLKQSAYVEYEIQQLQNVGAEVKICNADFKSENDIRTIINNSIGLGPVEGVYFIDKDKPSSSGFKVIKTLDLITRKLCPHLRYFGIIGSNTNNNLNTCITRSQDNLPVTNVILPPIKKMSTTPTARKGLISETDAINLFERALKLNEPVLLANVNSKKRQSIFNEITQFEEVKASDQLMGTATLSKEDIYDLTIPSIHKIQTHMFDLEHKSTKGLSTFYSRIDPDELLATSDMVFLPTLVNNSQMRDDEFDPTQTYLCIIPGLEGHHGRFRRLSEGLKLPVIVLQPGLDLPDESVSDLAKRYAGMLLKKTALKKYFYLLGYESGASVALEVAAIFEKQGLTGTIFCVGESPDKFHVTIKKELEEYTNDEALQFAVANHMIKLMLGENTIELKKELTAIETWPEKIEKCVSLILGKVSHSAQYARGLIRCAYGRIMQIQAYKPVPKALHSKLILINSATSAGSFSHSLQSYSQNPVTIYQLTTPLAHCAADLRCTSIINSHLDVSLLKEFENKNLCDTYLLNGNKFMDWDSNDA